MLAFRSKKNSTATSSTTGLKQTAHTADVVVRNMNRPRASLEPSHRFRVDSDATRSRIQADTIIAISTGSEGPVCF